MLAHGRDLLIPPAHCGAVKGLGSGEAGRLFVATVGRELSESCVRSGARVAAIILYSDRIG